MNIITNTTVLSNFAAIGQLDLLRQLYGTVYIPTEVYEEVQAGLEEGYRFYAGMDQLIHPFVEKGWIRLTSVTDEQEQGVRKSGSVGCLVLAVERGLCTLEQANSWLEDMIRHNYRSPVTDLTLLLKRG